MASLFRKRGSFEGLTAKRFLTPFLPRMTVGHLVFAAGMTAYIFMGTHFEEKDLVHYLGDEYRKYQEKVPNKFVSFRPKM